jgi:CHAD domain-containing protein
MAGSSEMRVFARRKLVDLLDGVIFAMHDALRMNDEEAIHRLRVSIRRLQQGLRIFAQYIRPGGLKRVKRRLKTVIRAAGQLRNYDIAIGLIESEQDQVPELSTSRQAARHNLTQTLRRVGRPDAGLKWKQSLGLDS